MALERAPASPLPNTYRPAGGRPYKVKNTDSFVSIAKAHGLDPLALIEFNFNTRDPWEVNWYLRRNVGCRRQTQDGKNYVFSAGDAPGIVYLPSASAPVPAAAPTNLWFGIGFKGGGHIVLIGKESFAGNVWSLDHFENRFRLDVDGWRVGPGLGAAGGIALVLITGVAHPNDLRNHPMSGADFQLALGARLGSVVKAVKELPWVIRIAREWKHARKLGQAAITFAEWEKSRDSVRQLLNATGVDLNPPVPQVTIFEIPGAGPGLEVSAYWGFGLARVSNVHFTQPGAGSGAPGG